jgi:hypothetical protein
MPIPSAILSAVEYSPPYLLVALVDGVVAAYVGEDSFEYIVRASVETEDVVVTTGSICVSIIVVTLEAIVLEVCSVTVDALVVVLEALSVVLLAFAVTPES